MNLFLRGLVQSVVESFSLPDPVLEIGSYQVDGQENIINLRQLFPGKTYHGLDIREGPGVDIVGSVEQLDMPDASLGTVLALSTFEHVQHFWKGFDEVYRVLRPDGALIVCCPFYFHVHAYPSDYWRFTPEALKLMLEKYPNKIIGWHGPKTRPANVWAIAFREEHPGFTPEQYQKYQSLMNKYAHQPLPWMRKMRYLLGRVLCGRRPFAPYLDRNSWETYCLTADANHSSKSDIAA